MPAMVLRVFLLQPTTFKCIKFSYIAWKQKDNCSSKFNENIEVKLIRCIIILNNLIWSIYIFRLFYDQKLILN